MFSLFPKHDKERKNLPVFKMVTEFFPKAMREVARVCVVNNVRFSPDREPHDIFWRRDRSKDHLGSGFRHMAERAVDGQLTEQVTEDYARLSGHRQVYVMAYAAFRALAQLELDIEKYEAGRKDLDEAMKPPVCIGARVRKGDEFTGVVVARHASLPDWWLVDAGGGWPLPLCEVGDWDRDVDSSKVYRAGRSAELEVIT